MLNFDPWQNGGCIDRVDAHDKTLYVKFASSKLILFHAGPKCIYFPSGSLSRSECWLWLGFLLTGWGQKAFSEYWQAAVGDRAIGWSQRTPSGFRGIRCHQQALPRVRVNAGSHGCSDLQMVLAHSLNLISVFCFSLSLNFLIGLFTSPIFNLHVWTVL